MVFRILFRIRTSDWQIVGDPGKCKSWGSSFLRGKIFTLVDAPFEKKKREKEKEKGGEEEKEKEGKRPHQHANDSSCYIRILVYIYI